MNTCDAICKNGKYCINKCNGPYCHYHYVYIAEYIQQRYFSQCNIIKVFNDKNGCESRDSGSIFKNMLFEDIPWDTLPEEIRKHYTNDIHRIKRVFSTLREILRDMGFIHNDRVFIHGSQKSKPDGISNVLINATYVNFPMECKSSIHASYEEIINHSDNQKQLYKHTLATKCPIILIVCITPELINNADYGKILTIGYRPR